MSKIGIIFDLDGTLWDVSNSTLESTNEVAEKHNVKKVTIQTVCNGMGLQTKENAKLYFPDIPLEEALKLKEEITMLNIKKLTENGGKLYSNVEQTLKILSENYDLFIVSNTGYQEYIESFFISSGMKKYFKSYLAASKLKISKGKAITKVINDYNLDKAIYVGDTKLDKEASEEAEIPFIQAKYGFGEDLKTSYGVDEIKELPIVIKNILGN